MKQKNKTGFFSILLGTSGASLLENLLTVKGTYRAGKDTSFNKFWNIKVLSKRI